MEDGAGLGERKGRREGRTEGSPVRKLHRPGLHAATPPPGLPVAADDLPWASPDCVFSNSLSTSSIIISSFIFISAGKGL